MKTRVKIAVAVAVLGLLALRGAYLRLHRAQDERQGYAQQLHLRFSAVVDSLHAFSRTNGLVYFHVVGAEPDFASEARANRHLKANAMLAFVLRSNGHLSFHARDLEHFRAGDSLAIDTDADKIRIFRHRALAAESQVSKALTGRVLWARGH